MCMHAGIVYNMSIIHMKNCHLLSYLQKHDYMSGYYSKTFIAILLHYIILYYIISCFVIAYIILFYITIYSYIIYYIIFHIILNSSTSYYIYCITYYIIFIYYIIMCHIILYCVYYIILSCINLPHVHVGQPLLSVINVKPFLHATAHLI